MKSVTKRNVSRRDFIQTLGVVTVSLALLPACSSKTASKRRSVGQVGAENVGLFKFFDEHFDEESDLIAVGAAYLSANPSENSIEYLLGQLCSSEGEVIRQQCSNGEYDYFVKQLAVLHIDDMERGAVVNVDGWVLSQTEARLYALGSLLLS